MNLGLSIFLSTILICSVWLYYITRDRWKWKKILKWVGFSILFLGFVLTSIFLFKRYYNESIRSTSNEIPELSHKRLDSLLRKDLEESLKPQLKKLTDLEGIALRESQKDVKFVKGKPLFINQHQEYWGYEDEQRNGFTSYKIKYIVVFKDKKVIAVIAEIKDKNESSLSERLKFISFYDEFKTKPTSQFEFDNDLKRLFFYSNFNCLQVKEKNESTHIGIYSPEFEEDIKKLIFSKPRFLY